MTKNAEIEHIFQSTLLQEERLELASIPFAKLHFNPRSYKRSDVARIVSPALTNVISIHAPTRGATAKMHNNPYTYL